MAHDNKKRDLLEWAEYNRALLIQHTLYATGTTGRMIEDELGVPVVKLKSGHDMDVKALLRIAVVWNIPVACNRASADFMISSILMSREYERVISSYEPYVERLARKQAED